LGVQTRFGLRVLHDHLVHLLRILVKGARAQKLYRYNSVAWIGIQRCPLSAEAV
jgi:hypothetical protein